MASEIIYVCQSINNKNVREGELNILQKYPEKLYFEFGENNMNIKKRFYNDLETLEKDYNALLKLKEEAKDQLDTKEDSIARKKFSKKENDLF